jgi:ribosomal protein S18 acetylase RimI-like enzyme
MSAPTIVVTDEPTLSDIEALVSGLTDHSLAFVDRPGFVPLGVFARDRDECLVGGIFAYVNWNWLSINLVWLSPELRGSGLGERLLETVEAAGIERGCRQAHLDTMSYQARPFYERHGYEVFATLDDYPEGGQRFFMRKRLVD